MVSPAPVFQVAEGPRFHVLGWEEEEEEEGILEAKAKDWRVGWVGPFLCQDLDYE
jgi:hypothetical protein